MDLEIINLENKSAGKVSFDIDENKEINRFAISQVVKWQLAKRRSGTAATKNRALVAGSGKKPFKQKGTGNARAGTRTSQYGERRWCHFWTTTKRLVYQCPKKIRKLALNNTILYKLLKRKNC